jgi:hypothetical protein
VVELPDFQKKQYAFAAHIRDPEHNASPDNVEDRRMAIYRELFFNNLHSLLSQTFPVLKKLHDPEKWRTLVRQFMAYELQDDDFPFLIELAHYEWVELALSVSEESNAGEQVEMEGDLHDGIPVNSALAWTYAYQFPVHRITTQFQPQEPGEQPTFLAVCRKANDDMDFMELNPVTARLLELIESNETESGRELLQKLAQEISYPDVDALITHGASAMEDMLRAEILLGVRK